ncbi:hypothetical protein CNMCM6106_004890 [Aspergillus hiratsukae]|uniref:DNA2/NAM7 helicase-like C-terminal domain-containing protein n=1 Tax=Aspergillus hiratsukae TaxID=1194566 RepID=A0A8H6V115_9EURO|nr:hypothetical protein CNMCM6106_004890 [Aspergillus hiratsukae]
MLLASQNGLPAGLPTVSGDWWSRTHWIEVESLIFNNERDAKADIVIVDWVVTSGEPSDLGFASDNRRANVALTRGRACFIVVADGQIVEERKCWYFISIETFCYATEAERWEVRFASSFVLCLVTPVMSPGRLPSNSSQRRGQSWEEFIASPGWTSRRKALKEAIEKATDEDMRPLWAGHTGVCTSWAIARVMVLPKETAMQYEFGKPMLKENKLQRAYNTIWTMRHLSSVLPKIISAKAKAKSLANRGAALTNRLAQRVRRELNRFGIRGRIANVVEDAIQDVLEQWEPLNGR